MFRVSTVLAFAGALLVAVALPLVAADQHVSQHEKANKLVAEQKYDRAIKLLKAANGKVGDSCVECYMGLAGAFQSTGELRKAEKQVRQAFELASDPVRKAFALNRLGLILFSGGDGDLRLMSRRAKKEGFKLVSISVDRSEKTLKKFLEQHEMDWPQHWDPNGPNLGALFRITAYPTYVVVGHVGVVTYRRSGWGERIASELDQAVRSALRAASKEARRGG